MDVALGVHRIVVPFLPDRSMANEAEERAYYMVAAMIASQPRNARDQGDTDSAPEDRPDGAAPQDGTADASTPRRRHWRNLGYSLAQAVDKGANANSLENHLQLLTRQNLDGLYRHLPRLILQLRGDQVRIDWGVLVHDLTRWASDPRLVAKEWAQGYYRTSEQLTAARKRKNAQATSKEHDNKETAS
jgi:CRISPR system Cascade subunit CasB